MLIRSAKNSWSSLDQATHIIVKTFYLSFFSLLFHFISSFLAPWILPSFSCFFNILFSTAFMLRSLSLQLSSNLTAVFLFLTCLELSLMPFTDFPSFLSPLTLVFLPRTGLRKIITELLRTSGTCFSCTSSWCLSLRSDSADPWILLTLLFPRLP